MYLEGHSYLTLPKEDNPEHCTIKERQQKDAQTEDANSEDATTISDYAGCKGLTYDIDTLKLVTKDNCYYA